MNATGNVGEAHGSALPSQENKAAFVRAMFDRISPRYDLTNRLMTMGMDIHWRRYAAKSLAMEPGGLALDVACGTGDFVRLLRSMGYRVIGGDFSLGMLTASDQAGLVQADAARLPFADNSFDGLTCGFALRNFTSLPTVLAEMARVVRPGGRIALVEVARPEQPLIKAGHGFYFDHIVPRIGAMVSDSDAYKYLPQSTVYLPPEPALRSMLGEAGFRSIAVKYFLLHSAQVISATRAQ